MTALVGKPLRIAVRLDNGEADYEIHHPAPGTELVVCGDCGFEWDAVHTVTDDAGRVGYECPRCVLRLFVAARQKVIEDTVRAGVAQLAATLRRDVAKHQRDRDAARARADALLDDLASVRAQLSQCRQAAVTPPGPGFYDLLPDDAKAQVDEAVIRAAVGAANHDPAADDCVRTVYEVTCPRGTTGCDKMHAAVRRSAPNASQDEHSDGGSLRFGKQLCPDCRAPRDEHDEWDFRFCPRTGRPLQPTDSSCDPRDAVVSAARELMAFVAGDMDRLPDGETYSARLVAALDAVPESAPGSGNGPQGRSADLSVVNAEAIKREAATLRGSVSMTVLTPSGSLDAIGILTRDRDEWKRRALASRRDVAEECARICDAYQAGKVALADAEEIRGMETSDHDATAWAAKVIAGKIRALP